MLRPARGDSSIPRPPVLPASLSIRVTPCLASLPDADRCLLSECYFLDASPEESGLGKLVACEYPYRLVRLWIPLVAGRGTGTGPGPSS